MTDAQLLALCAAARPSVDYSSCTSVTALLAGDLLTVAHLGDSRVALGSVRSPLIISPLGAGPLAATACSDALAATAAIALPPLRPLAVLVCGAPVRRWRWLRRPRRPTQSRRRRRRRAAVAARCAAAA